MADKLKQQQILLFLKGQHKPLGLRDIQELSKVECAERSLRRWLRLWAENGHILIQGQKRSTRYLYIAQQNKVPPFLSQVPEKKRVALLKQLRDLWTHNSTAIEGNTLSLGDTHFILEQGLTISGKPLREHQEVVGHAKAIDILYTGMSTTLNENLIFDLHKAVQTDYVNDIYKPYGGWKVEVNGTYVVTRDNKQVFIEYALPAHTPQLMAALIHHITAQTELNLENAAKQYAYVHAAFVHIHPFFDGNGRLARLLANLPLLKCGLPPLLINNEQRQAYIQILADYEIQSGQLNNAER